MPTWNYDPDIRYDIRIDKNRQYDMIVEDDDITADWVLEGSVQNADTGAEVVSFDESKDMSNKSITFTIYANQTEDIDAGGNYIYEVSYRTSPSAGEKVYMWGYVEFSDTAP